MSQRPRRGNYAGLERESDAVVVFGARAFLLTRNEAGPNRATDTPSVLPAQSH